MKYFLFKCFRVTIFELFPMKNLFIKPFLSLYMSSDLTFNPDEILDTPLWEQQTDLSLLLENKIVNYDTINQLMYLSVLLIYDDECDFLG